MAAIINIFGQNFPGTDIRPLVSSETELIALNVLHNEARLVIAIGWQEPYALCAEGDQTSTFTLQRSKAFLAHESGTDPYVEMQTVLEDLAFRDALEVQSSARTRRIHTGTPTALILRRLRTIEVIP